MGGLAAQLPTRNVYRKVPNQQVFSHERTNEVLWIENWLNPPGVEAQSNAGSKVDVRHAAPGLEFNRMAGLNLSQFVGYQTGSRGTTSALITSFERRAREGVTNDYLGTCGDVTSLCKTGRLKDALHILTGSGFWADSKTYVCILQECINRKGLAEGKQVHAHIVQSGFKPSIFLLNTLVNMYVRCGSVVDARQVFDKMPEREMFTWNTMIGGYAKHGCGREAFEIYEQMKQEEVTPSKVTYTCLLNACARLGALEKGKEVHADISKVGIAPDIIMETALADMYAKCGSMRDARQVFDNMAKRNVVSWSAMITGYAQHGCGGEALEMYEQMQQEDVTPDKVTFICVLNACASLGDLEVGKKVHADLSKTEIGPDMILETALADMYAKCGSMKDARQVFDNMVNRNVVSWSAMIAGYALDGCGKEALEIYEKMLHEGVTPNKVTFMGILNACASIGALYKGKQVHVDIIKAGIPPYIDLETALVDMYAKCGSVKDACEVFDKMAQRDVVSWSVMLTGCAQHGCAREALQRFEQMQQEGLKPDSVTILSLLSACNHGGLVDEGRHYFDSMIQDHGLTPTVEHFSCMVDLLGRAGRLDEAEDFINIMPVEPDALVWEALLGACRVHGDVELAERTAKSILKTDPQNAAGYVLLSNIYAAAGRWNDKAIVTKMMQDRGVRKERVQLD